MTLIKSTDIRLACRFNRRFLLLLVFSDRCRLPSTRLFRGLSMRTVFCPLSPRRRLSSSSSKPYSTFSGGILSASRTPPFSFPESDRTPRHSCRHPLKPTARRLSENESEILTSTRSVVDPDSEFWICSIVLFPPPCRSPSGYRRCPHLNMT